MLEKTNKKGVLCFALLVCILYIHTYICYFLVLYNRISSAIMSGGLFLAHVHTISYVTIGMSQKSRAYLSSHSGSRCSNRKPLPSLDNMEDKNCIVRDIRGLHLNTDDTLLLLKLDMLSHSPSFPPSH